jgi:hypothetical protein
MNADGSGRTRLTDIPGNDHWPPTTAKGRIVPPQQVVTMVPQEGDNPK